MKPIPGKPLPPGCAVVLKDCTFGDQERAFRASLARHVGHVVKLPEIKRYSPPRSNQQNKTVWGLWMPIVIEEMGYRPHDTRYVYDSLKMKIGWTEERVNKLTGEVKKLPRATADCDKAEYSKFMELFRAYVEDQDTGLGVLLPDPDSNLARI